MIIQLRDVEKTEAETLKLITGQNTASGAYLYAASVYGFNQIEIADLRRELIQVKQQLSSAVEVIEGARTAAALLLDRTSAAYLDLPEGH